MAEMPQHTMLGYSFRLNNTIFMSKRINIYSFLPCSIHPIQIVSSVAFSVFQPASNQVSPVTFDSCVSLDFLNLEHSSTVLKHVL